MLFIKRYFSNCLKFSLSKKTAEKLFYKWIKSEGKIANLPNVEINVLIKYLEILFTILLF